MDTDSKAALGPITNSGAEVQSVADKRLRKLRRERLLIDQAILSLTEIARVRQKRFRQPIAIDRRLNGS
jgi:hypothetical protein